MGYDSRKRLIQLTNNKNKAANPPRYSIDRCLVHRHRATNLSAIKITAVASATTILQDYKIVGNMIMLLYLRSIALVKPKAGPRAIPLNTTNK